MSTLPSVELHKIEIKSSDLPGTRTGVDAGLLSAPRPDDDDDDVFSRGGSRMKCHGATGVGTIS
jgi:hypothetical protein